MRPDEPPPPDPTQQDESTRLEHPAVPEPRPFESVPEDAVRAVPEDVPPPEPVPRLRGERETARDLPPPDQAPTAPDLPPVPRIHHLEAARTGVPPRLDGPSVRVRLPELADGRPTPREVPAVPARRERATTKDLPQPTRSPAWRLAAGALGLVVGGALLAFLAMRWIQEPAVASPREVPPADAIPSPPTDAGSILPDVQGAQVADARQADVPGDVTATMRDRFDVPPPSQDVAPPDLDARPPLPDVPPPDVPNTGEPVPREWTHVVHGTAADVEAPWLALRDGPSGEATLLDQLPDGTHVRVLARHGRWWRVEVVGGDLDGHAGWAHARWLK